MRATGAFPFEEDTDREDGHQVARLPLLLLLALSSSGTWTETISPGMAKIRFVRSIFGSLGDLRRTTSPICRWLVSIA